MIWVLPLSVALKEPQTILKAQIKYFTFQPELAAAVIQFITHAGRHEQLMDVLTALAASLTGHSGQIVCPARIFFLVLKSNHES
jgi:hypothetical protein